MKGILGTTEELLNRSISGYHQYILHPAAQLAYVSQNMCDLLGCTRRDLLHDGEDRYAALVHPDDRAIYAGFLRKLAASPQTQSVQYRIVRTDGETMHISDTATSRLLNDGTMVADSVLTDITAVQDENENLRFLNDTLPCGFIRYTCEKHPKITYVNRQLLEMLRFPEAHEGEIDYVEMYRNDIYLMIPMEERLRFSQFLDRVYEQNTTICGEITVLRCDGTRARIYGWITKHVNAHGQEEFQSVCMDISDRYRKSRESELQRYLKALEDVYDKIFAYDFSNLTVKYVYGHNSRVFSQLKDIPMQLEAASDQWIQRWVYEDDREAMRTFIQKVFNLRSPQPDSKPPQIRFRAYSSLGEIRLYTGIYLKIDATTSLFCCRNITETPETRHLRDEIATLRNMNENMHGFVMRFVEGIVAFEVADGMVRPMYTSDNVCEFFGYTREEWINMAQNSVPISDFVSKCGVELGEFMQLLEEGEAEFEYTDLNTNEKRRIRAVCSHLLSDDPSPQYVMLYHVADAPQRIAGEPRVSIRTFGYFDVFVDDKPIAFRNEKSKELLALLVDRRGGYISSEEAISFLWEDESANPITLARYRKVALRLKNSLEEHGISDIIESVNGRRRIVPEKVKCDLYDYLSHKDEHAQLFKGSYLSNYSWAEATLGELLNQ